MAHKPSGLSGFFHYPERALLAGLLASCLICLFLRLEKWLPYRLSLWGGDISYMVYLLHLPTLWLFARFVSPALPQGMPSLGMALALVMILGLSTLLHLAAERPAYRWFKGLT
jgi:peptidoglycan/LPS O-acetylase OafA/YrhL